MEALKATKREALGTHSARRMRKDGLTPCVIYGHGQETVHVALNEHDLNLAIHHGEHLLEVDLGGAKETVFIKDYQYDVFGHVLLHADLTRVNLNESVEVTLPVVLRGTPEGLKEGGVVQQQNSEVTIMCLVTNIPEDIRPLINDMQVGDVLTIGDLELPDGAELVTDASLPVCSVTIIEEREEVEEFDADAAPEVIGEKPGEDGSEEGAGE
jgi:large subunit ribosomal protein L25